jgi:hypothetical protein
LKETKKTCKTSLSTILEEQEEEQAVTERKLANDSATKGEAGVPKQAHRPNL